METSWPSIFAFLGVFSFAILSPGPNFIMVSNAALNQSRRDGLLTALGVATGSGIFACAGLAGLLPLVRALPHFAEITRFVGGGYLAWIGFDMLRTSRRKIAPPAPAETRPLSPALVAYRTGLLTNLTNPKAWAFYLSLFTLVMGPDYPLWSKLVLNVAMFAISLGWYASVACLVSSRTFQPLFLSWRPYIQAVLGLVLVAAGAGILLEIS